MQTSVMIGFAIAGMFVLLGIAVFMQRLEENRRQRARRIRDITLRLRKYWAALTEMPEGSLPPALQMILVQGITAELKALRQLHPGAPEIGHYHEQLKALVPKIKSAPAQAAQLDLSEEPKVRALRARMRALHQLITGLSESRMIDANATGQFLNHINQLNGETLVALYLMQARAAVRQGKPAIAIHQLDLCISELQKINQRGNWNVRLLELAGIQENLANFGAFSEEEAAELALERQQAGETEGGDLGDELQHMFDEEDSWKKKAQYD